MDCWTIPARIIHTGRWIINPWSFKRRAVQGPITFTPPAPPTVIPPETVCVQQPGGWARGWFAPVRRALPYVAAAIAVPALPAAYYGAYLGGGWVGSGGLTPYIAPIVRTIQPPPTITLNVPPVTIHPLPPTERQIDFYTPQPAVTDVPEPATWGLLGVGILGLCVVRTARPRGER